MLGRHRLTVIGALALAGLTLLTTLPALADSELLQRFEDKTTVHVLDNGWTFIIVERPVAPVFSFATIVDVGSAQEVPGITGLAHMFEHMAFKGTPNIGTTDFAAEKLALAEVEAAYEAYELEHHNPQADEQQVAELLETFRAKQEAAFAFVIPNEFGDIIEREGGADLNAFTNTDITGYFYSLPANKLELFAYLESERFLHPVFREFYKERDVVQEERRLRTESQPVGRLIEQTVSTAFSAHPYQQPVVGHMSDLKSFTATDAEAFYKKHYVPSNMVTALVGQLDAQRIIPILERYFSRIPAGSEPARLRTIEPKQIAEKQVVILDASQPWYAEMYHRPSGKHPDNEVYSAIDDVLSNGRTSRLYRSMVRDKKIATFAFSISSFPGSKYPSLWGALGITAKDHENEEIQSALRVELERLKTEPISDGEMRRFRTRATANLIRSLSSNIGIAGQFSSTQTSLGDWRESFRRLDRIQQVTPDDIQRVARETFVPSNRTVGMIVTKTAEETSDADGAS